MSRPLLLLAACLVGACSNDIQMTSGAEFVAARDEAGFRPIDADIAKIASVEPNLHFPARIGWRGS